MDVIINNIIFVADRAYFNYDLFNIFNNNDYKYVKENAQIDKTIKETNKQKSLIEEIKKKSRIIKYKTSILKKVFNKKYKNINCVNEYTLITNIMDDT